MKPGLGQITLRFARTDSMASETESPSVLIRNAHTICSAAAHRSEASLSVEPGLRILTQLPLLHDEADWHRCQQCPVWEAAAYWYESMVGNMLLRCDVEPP